MGDLELSTADIVRQVVFQLLPHVLGVGQGPGVLAVGASGRGFAQLLQKLQRAQAVAIVDQFPDQRAQQSYIADSGGTIYEHQKKRIHQRDAGPHPQD